MIYNVSGNNRVDFTAYAPMHTFAGWADKGLGGLMDIDVDNETLSNLEAEAHTLDFTTGDDERTKAMFDYFCFDQHPGAAFAMTECQSLALLKEEHWQARIVGILEFVGIRRQLPLTCNITRHPDHLDLDLNFKWSFKAYGLKAPRLLFLTVKDIVDIKVHLEFFAEENK